MDLLREITSRQDIHRFINLLRANNYNTDFVTSYTVSRISCGKCSEYTALILDFTPADPTQYEIFTTQDNWLLFRLQIEEITQGANIFIYDMYRIECSGSNRFLFIYNSEPINEEPINDKPTNHGKPKICCQKQ